MFYSMMENRLTSENFKNAKDEKSSFTLVVNITPQKASQEEYAPPHQESVAPQEQKGLYNEPPFEFEDNIPF